MLPSSSRPSAQVRGVFKWLLVPANDGATTRAALLTGPLRDRFGIIFRLEYYTQDEMQELQQLMSKLLCIVCRLTPIHDGRQIPSNSVDFQQVA